jgi:hypothetical protein
MWLVNQKRIINKYGAAREWILQIILLIPHSPWKRWRGALFFFKNKEERDECCWCWRQAPQSACMLCDDLEVVLVIPQFRPSRPCRQQQAATGESAWRLTWKLKVQQEERTSRISHRIPAACRAIISEIVLLAACFLWIYGWDFVSLGTSLSTDNMHSPVSARTNGQRGGQHHRRHTTRLRADEASNRPPSTWIARAQAVGPGWGLWDLRRPSGWPQVSYFICNRHRQRGRGAAVRNLTDDPTRPRISTKG